MSKILDNLVVAFTTILILNIVHTTQVSDAKHLSREPICHEYNKVHGTASFLLLFTDPWNGGNL